MADWKVERGRKQCAATERPFEEGEVYFSVLIEQDDTFQRLDFSLEVWKEQEKNQFFSFWRTRMPSASEEPKRRFIDTEVIYNFFTRLADAESEMKLTFRYLLALILLRKRFLRLDEIIKQDGEEYLAVWDRRVSKYLRILNPHATCETLEEAQRELSCIFDMDFVEPDESKAEVTTENEEDPDSELEAEEETEEE
ncbi:MAG: hypothetical protein JXA52_08475 [Planctomycetes bacterium]|nr:hypothetical protein [Planctomycetota bacterium]